MFQYGDVKYSSVRYTLKLESSVVKYTLILIASKACHYCLIRNTGLDKDTREVVIHIVRKLLQVSYPTATLDFT